jgi:hypothetical protein
VALHYTILPFTIVIGAIFFPGHVAFAVTVAVLPLSLISVTIFEEFNTPSIFMVKVPSTCVNSVMNIGEFAIAYTDSV